MDYKISPFGKIWENGIFNVPNSLAERYIKFSSEYQLKALLLILKNNGVYSAEQIAKDLGITKSDAEDFMEFWIAEGVVSKNGEETEKAVEPAYKPEIPEEKPKKESKKISMTPPSLTPAEVIEAGEGSPVIAELFREAEKISPSSHKRREMLVNFVDFYGLKPEIILMILQYYQNEREKERPIGDAYIYKMAQNWMDEGIDTLDAAEEKLNSIEQSDKLWKEITALAGIRHKNPTVKQREMVNGWKNDFNIEMISIAIEIMKENTESPTLKYVDSILKSWKKKGIKTPDDVNKEKESFNKTKSDKKNSRIGGKPSYDIGKIDRETKDSMEIKF